MKQHDFDDIIKDEISSFEESNKPEWNKNKVYERIISTQSNSQTQILKKGYWIAAVILFLIFLNAFQFTRYNIINHSSNISSRNTANLKTENRELQEQLQNSIALLGQYEANINSLTKKVEKNDSTIQYLELYIDNIKPKNEIKYITEYVHDTVYIEKYIEEEFIAQNENIDTEKSSEEIIQFVNSFKPLVTQKNNQQNKIRIKIGSDISKNGQMKNEPNTLLSAEL